MMRAYLALRMVCVLAAIACLALGYIAVGDWLILLAVPAGILFWLAAGRRSGFWAASALLALYVGLAAIGIASRAPALLIATGCIFALAGWELSDPRGRTSEPASQRYGTRLEKRRLQSLGILAAVSLLLAVVPSALRLQLPFGIVALLALVAAGGVLYSVQYLKHTAAHGPRQ